MTIQLPAIEMDGRLEGMLTGESASLSLAGSWGLALDAEDQGVVCAWPQMGVATSEIHLPGTTDFAGVGEHRLASPEHDCHLTREYAHRGPAWYFRTISVPEAWVGDEVELVLERVMWQSRVWLDGQELGEAQDSLSTPHRHRLGRLAAGEHRLAIRVDNRMIHPIGDKGHAYGDQTQSMWNGVVGDLCLERIPGNRIEQVRIFTELDGTVACEVSGVTTSAFPVKLHAVTGSVAAMVPVQINQPGHRFVQMIKVQVSEPIHWSEFSPQVYPISFILKNDQGHEYHRVSTTFGFRSVTRDGNQLRINQRPVFLRGNLECAVFPKTGHPPTDVASWKAIWQVYREHGLNHARFHSWCPPEAAFVAADELGMYLQVEAPIWMDRWMAAPNPRPEMDTEGYPKGLGHGDRSNDAFAQREIRRILDVYGNHPSFVMFCIGNELGSSDFKSLESWIGQAKQRDPRRLYAASTARAITSQCDFNASHDVPGVGMVRQHLEPSTAWNYEANYQKTPVPIVAHEIGQWPIYPNWEAELVAYTGPLKPYRLQALAKLAKQRFSAEELADFHAASGAMNRLLYRDEISSFLRTPSCRGFQLLGMQDFTGQGEALVGWLDPFYQSKHTTDAADFRRYCAPTVALIEVPSRTTRNVAGWKCGFLVHHYGARDMVAVTSEWRVTMPDGAVVAQGEFPALAIPTGAVTRVGWAEIDLSQVKAACPLTVAFAIAGGEFSQQETVWVYPPTPAIPEGPCFTEDWTQAKAALAEGRAVLLDAHALGVVSNEKLAHWLPLYWSTPFFPGQNRDTLGLCVRARHPALAHFPTPTFSDWNWYRVCLNAHGFVLPGELPSSYRPIVQPVSDFHHPQRLGAIFETRVGTGKLMVCGFDLSSQRCSQIPEVAQLKYSLMAYLASPECRPDEVISLADLERLLANADHSLAPVPEPFGKARVFIRAGAKAPMGRQPWSLACDHALRLPPPHAYVVKAEAVVHADTHSAWLGKSITFELKTPAGTPGRLMLHLIDPDHQQRQGTIECEGHSKTLALHPDGTWVEFPIMREDTNDGKLVVQAKAVSGPNLLVSAVVFIPD